MDIFPEHVATLGTVALVFVFHPDYRNDFDFRCEGVAHQGGQLAWQIHFQQKPEVQSRLRSYQLGTRYFRVGIKGRAWIAADSFQILRMESDLVTQVPALRLNAEHQDIPYGPVPLKKREILLWLPFSAEIYLDFDGHRIHRSQDLATCFLLGGGHAALNHQKRPRKARRHEPIDGGHWMICGLAQPVEAIESGGLIAFRQRGIVEYRINEIRDGALQEQHRLSDV